MEDQEEKLELQRAREFGDIINDTFVFIKQNFGPLMRAYITICGFFLVAQIAVEIVSKLRDLDDGSAGSPFNASYWWSLLFTIVTASAITITIYSYMALYREKGKVAPTVTEVWGYFRYFFVRVFGAHIVVTLCIIAGFVMCVFPGIYLTPILALVVPIMIMENASLNYSFNYSFRLIKENWWFIFGLLIIIFIIYYAGLALVVLPGTIISGGAEWVSGMKFNSSEIIVESVSMGIARIFYVVPCIAMALAYFSLSDQKHGTSLINRIQALGKNPLSDDRSSEQY